MLVMFTEDCMGFSILGVVNNFDAATVYVTNDVDENGDELVSIADECGVFDTVSKAVYSFDVDANCWVECDDIEQVNDIVAMFNSENYL